MPFQSKRQQRAAFAGVIPGFDRSKALEWAHETPNLKDLPDRAPAEKGKPTLRSKKAQTDQQSAEPHALAGGAALLGGGIAMNQAAPLVTGRTRLYHGTTPENANTIRRRGLLPSANVKGPAITDILAPDIKEQAKDLAYLTPSRMEAGGYAGQADFLKRKVERGLNPLSPEHHGERVLATVKGQLAPFGEGLVKADVPLWKKEIADTVRKNPEARGSFEEFMKHQGLMAHFQRDQLREVHKSLDRAVAVKGGLSPKYIQGSPTFQRVGLQELGEYARARPGRFATGLGLGALGVAGLGLGAHQLAKAVTQPEKKANYKLEGETKFRGLDIAIENKKGSKRYWHDPHGKEKGSTFMHYDYGYIRLTKGTDGDHVDVYIGPDEDAENVFIVDQMKKPDFKEFDEQKVMLGFKTEAEAKAAYLKQYNDSRFFGSMKSMPFEEFKTKVLDKGNHGEKISMMYIAPAKIALSLGTVQSALAQRAAQGVGGAAALGRGIASAAEHGATTSRSAMQHLGGLGRYQLANVAEGGTALRKVEQSLANPTTQAMRGRVLGAVRDEAAGAATRTGAPLSNAYEGYMTSSQHAYSPEHLGQVLGTSPVHLKNGPSQLATQLGTSPGARSVEKTVVTPRSGVRRVASTATAPTLMAPTMIAPKVAEESRADRIKDRIEDLGLGVLAAPAASHLAEIGTRKLMLRGGRLGGLAALAHGPAEQASKFFDKHVPEHATELGGLAVLSPALMHPVANAVDRMLPAQKPKTGPQEPLVAGQADQMSFKRAEEIGRALAREKTAINVGGAVDALGRAAWNNRRTLAGIGAVGAVGAGLYGAKKTVDAATNLATAPREPVRYSGVPAGMRPPAPAMLR